MDQHDEDGSKLERERGQSGYSPEQIQHLSTFQLCAFVQGVSIEVALTLPTGCPLCFSDLVKQLLLNPTFCRTYSVEKAGLLATKIWKEYPRYLGVKG
jgi:hypothetical protein